MGVTWLWTVFKNKLILNTKSEVILPRGKKDIKPSKLFDGGKRKIRELCDQKLDWVVDFFAYFMYSAAFEDE